MSPFVLHHGDCREVIKTLADSSVDSVVTDPPYALVSIVKRFGGENAAPAKGDVYARASAGFMGKQWDTGEVAFDPSFWADVMRVLKPGGHVVAFGGSRTYHRLACAIEDAGFEIRDQVQWIYGSGFPKSHNAGNGWGTALKPAHEPIVLARKPLIGTVAHNVLAYGTGAINVDACRVGFQSEADRWNPEHHRRGSSAHPMDWGKDEQRRESEPASGRWPANIIHDGSPEVEEAFAAFGEKDSRPAKTLNRRASIGFGGTDTQQIGLPGSIKDTGTASRFFYCAKASKADRGDGNTHPTVKPTELMRYLCRLVTPLGGTVLDPFMGSGSTGRGAILEGFSFIGIEREAEYLAIAERRIAAAEASTKPPEPANDELPLFGWTAAE